mgnify:CR=1 FL=1
MVEFFTRMGQSEATYAALEAFVAGEEWAGMDATRQRLVEKELLGMKLSGISLDGEAKERFNEIQMLLAERGTRFSHNVLDATKAFSLMLRDSASVKGLPQRLLEMTAQAARDAGEKDVRGMRLGKDVPAQEV